MEIGLEGMDIELVQVACCCEHSNESSGSVKYKEFIESWQTITFPRRTLCQELDNDFVI
jgi:hypothetical protein